MVNPFRKLHWQLALLFAAVTTAVSMTISVGSAAISLAKSPSRDAVITKIAEELSQSEGDIARALSASPVDAPTLARRTDDLLYLGELLDFPNDENAQQYISMVSYAAILGRDGHEIVNAAQESDMYLSRPPLNLAAALNGEHVASLDPITDETTVLYPVQSDEEILGIVRIDIFIPTPDSLPLSDLITFHLQDLPPILIASLLLGAVLGYGATQNLVRRLNTLAQTSTQWAQGKFDLRVKDQRKDEISELGHHLNQMAGDLEQLVETRAQLAALEERGHIARDLHDTVKQKVFATQMQLSSAELALQTQPEKTAEIIQNAILLNKQTQSDLAEIIHALRPAALHNKGLVEAASEYAHEWSQRTGVQVEISTQNAARLPLLLEDNLYRVIQEALSNIEKHARATKAGLHFEWRPKIFQITIKDDGAGFDPQAIFAGYGLENMRTRIEDQNGEFSIDSHPGEGTALTIRLPYQKA